MTRVFALDVGGTFARVAVYEGTDPLWVEVHRTVDLRPLRDLVMDAIRDHDIEACGVAIAGPVDHGRARVTHGTWSASVADIAVPSIVLNDLAAAAAAIPVLTANDLVHLGGPAPDPKGVACVLGLGTGIGEAILVHDEPVAGEGGHADFAPWDALSSAFLAWLHATKGTRIAIEDAIGGRAIADLLAFVAAREPLGAQVERALHEHDPAVVLVEWADRDPGCAVARELLLGALGAEAGNLALRHLPRRGVYVVGGLARALRAPLVASSAFDRAFSVRGGMTDLVATIPRFVVTHPDPGLVGAAAAARKVLATA